MKEFGRDACHDSIVGHRFVYYGIGSYHGIFAHADTAEDDSAFADAGMVAYRGNSGIFGITPPYCNLLSDRYIVAYPGFAVDDDTHAAVAELRTFADMGLIRDFAVVDKENEQRDELR